MGQVGRSGLQYWARGSEAAREARFAHFRNCSGVSSCGTARRAMLGARLTQFSRCSGVNRPHTKAMAFEGDRDAHIAIWSSSNKSDAKTSALDGASFTHRAISDGVAFLLISRWTSLSPIFIVVPMCLRLCRLTSGGWFHPAIHSGLRCSCCSVWVFDGGDLFQSLQEFCKNRTPAAN